jgi:hypothetical protein
MKDALGHGSDAGAHSAGVQKAGQRYHVKLKPYSLAENKVGQSHGRDITISTHRSLSAAGDKLGSLISGKLAGTAKSMVDVARVVTGEPTAARYLIEDRMTGNHYSRNGAKTGTPIDRNTSVWKSEK